MDEKENEKNVDQKPSDINESNVEESDSSTMSDKNYKVNPDYIKQKAPLPKLPFIIGGAVAGIAAIAATVAIVLGGGGHEHSFGEWILVDEPTCLATGVEERICECGEKESKTIDALGHTEVVDGVVQATCDKTGLTEGKHCSVCGETTVKQTTVAKLPHTYDDGNDSICNLCGATRIVDCEHTDTEILQGKSASCTETGLTDGEKCKSCGEITVAQQTIPIVAHTYDNKYDEDCNFCGYKRDAECAHTETETIDGYDATCTATGLTDGEKCKKCGETVITGTIIPVKPHNEETLPSLEASCTETGLTEGKKCSVCGTVTVAQQTIPIVAHTYDNKYDEDCNFCGYKRDAECAHTETETIEGYDATCTATGLTDGKKCEKCGETLEVQVLIPMKPHAEVIDPAAEASCTQTGLTQGKHCSVCNNILVAQDIVPIKPHTEVVDPAVEPTCTSTGLTEGKHCSVCNKVLIAQNTVPMAAHTEAIDTAVEPTCTQAGLTQGKHCSVCNEVLVEQTVVGALGHKYSSSVTAPTATKDGFATHTCSRCGDHYSETITAIDFTVTSSNRSQIGYTGENNENLVIPAVFQNDGIWYRIVEISGSAFHSCTLLTSVAIPDSVTSIGSYAFKGCTGLTSVKFGDNSQLTSIGYDAFYSCTSLTSITIPDSMTSIGSYAFEGCKGLTSITIPDSVTVIGSYAFYCCTNLTSVSFGDNSQLTRICFQAFYKCTSLTSITIPDSVTSIDERAFEGCTSHKAVYITDIAAWYNISFGHYLSNPLFYSGNLYLNGELVTELVIPDSVTSIGSYAFSGCGSLTSVTIGNGVTSIGYDAFRSCTSLESIAVEEENLNYYSCDGILYDKPVTKIICVPFNISGDITIPDGITSIDSYAFDGRTSLTSITIPDSVTSIGNCAFQDCTGLTSITIPDSVTSIGKWAFEGCTSLESIAVEEENLNYYSCDGILYDKPVTKIIYIPLNISGDITIPDGITSIGSFAFDGLTSLTSITIPDSVTSIGNVAFGDCTSLESITIPFVGATKDDASNTHFGYIFGANSYSYNETYVPTSLKSVTITAATSIYEYAFSGCSSLTSITIPDSVTSIGKWAFEGCTSLTSVTFENTDGWICVPNLSQPNYFTTIKIYSSKLSDPATAATYLKSTYYSYYWKRS